MLATTDIAWPWVLPQTIHVKISDTETWDCPASWGAERINSDLKRRLAVEDEEARRRIENMSATRRAEWTTAASLGVERGIRLGPGSRGEPIILREVGHQ
jgi:hypothetical protein